MDIFFPIADVYANVFAIMAIGFGGGLLSGSLGLGAGIFITPSLLLMGIPSFVAVTTQLMNSMGTNLIGFISHARTKDVDVALGFYLFLGGIAGAATEYMIFSLVYSAADPYAIIRITGAVCLVLLGIGMSIQSIKTLFNPDPKDSFLNMRYWMIYFPMHRIFLRTRAEISILIPILVGFLTGLLTTTLGGGANMFIVPIITYLIGRTSPAVTGTSLMAAFFINLSAACLYGLGTAPCDILLLALLFFCSCFGSYAGKQIAARFSRVYAGIVAGLIVLFVGVQLSLELYRIGGKQKSQSFLRGTTNYLNDLLDKCHDATPVLNKIIIQWASSDPVQYAIMALCGVLIFAIAFEIIGHRVRR